MGNFTPIGKIIPRALKRRTAAARRVHVSTVLDDAIRAIRKTVGDAAAELAKPEGFDNGILTLSCAAASVAAEVRMRSEEVIGEINKDRSGRDEVRAIAVIRRRRL